MKKASQKDAQSAIHVLKAGTCPSLSGKSKLTYHIGCTAESEVQFRVVANSKAGLFNDDWIQLNAIQQAFAKVAGDKPVTSHVLYPLFRGKSQNTPAFLMAALKQEGLVRATKDTHRQYERIDPKGFIAEVKALASKVPPKADPKGDSKAGDLKVDPKGAPKGEQKAGKKAPTKSSKKNKG